MALERSRGRLPAERRGVPWGWVAVGAVGGIAAMAVLDAVLGFVFGVVRLAVIVAGVAVLAWLVLIGPPDRRRRRGRD